MNKDSLLKLHPNNHSQLCNNPIPLNPNLIARLKQIAVQENRSASPDLKDKFQMEGIPALALLQTRDAQAL